MYMYEHFNNIVKLYGNKAYIQMPNDIFRDLESVDTNIQQISFCFSYLVTVSFLYKYAHFVDVDNGTYIQNADIKELLGYNRLTKTVDKYIKKNGILENLKLVETTKDYPVEVVYIEEEINNISMREFKTISMLDDDTVIKSIVKNRNYNVKEPKFFFEYKDDIGTLYNYSKTFRIEFSEFMRFMYDDSLDNTDFILYCYFKSKCYGYKDNMKQIPLGRIVSDIGIKKDSYYSHLSKLKEKGFIEANHKGWQVSNNSDDVEANDYYFKGIQ